MAPWEVRPTRPRSSRSLFFREYDAQLMMHWFIGADFEIVFCLESADSNCTAVFKSGKIQNTKLRIEHSTFFGQWKCYQYFPRAGYDGALTVVLRNC